MCFCLRHVIHRNLVDRIQTASTLYSCATLQEKQNAIQSTFPSLTEQKCSCVPVQYVTDYHSGCSKGRGRISFVTRVKKMILFAPKFSEVLWIWLKAHHLGKESRRHR